MPDDELVKYGDHQCPRCRAHDVSPTSETPYTGGTILRLLCLACGHTWSVTSPLAPRIQTGTSSDAGPGVAT